MHLQPTQCRGGVTVLLENDGVEAECVHSAATELLGDLQAVDANFCGLRVQLAGDNASSFPFGDVRHDLLADKLPNGVAERLVILGVDVPEHVSLLARYAEWGFGGCAES